MCLQLGDTRMKNTRAYIACLMAVILLPCMSQAFDGRHEGFCLGISAGTGWVTSSDYRTADDGGNSAFTPSVMFGVGLTPRTSAILEIPMAFYVVDGWNDIVVLAPTVGARYYVGDGMNTPYFGAGLGFSFDNSHGYDGSPPYTGYLGRLTVGYLYRHLDSRVWLQAGDRFQQGGTLTMVSVSIGYLFF